MAGLKPFSQACANNSSAIAAKLVDIFSPCHRVLEIGSGTGQHAVYFAPLLRHLLWQPSDRAENLPGIHSWMAENPSDNLLPPLLLDVDGAWPATAFDGFFSANTCHIMAWPTVVNLFAGIGRLAQPESTLAIYGPFKYQGEFTTQSNANFDLWLKSQAPHQGVRNSEDIVQLANDIGFRLQADHPMPANNQLLVFVK
jgi:hypothetical protein